MALSYGESRLTEDAWAESNALLDAVWARNAAERARKEAVRRQRAAELEEQRSAQQRQQRMQGAIMQAQGPPLGGPAEPRRGAALHVGFPDRSAGGFASRPGYRRTRAGSPGRAMEDEGDEDEEDSSSARRQP
jgi:hypothetical protein